MRPVAGRLTKTCHVCKSHLPLENFHYNRARGDGRADACKKCKRETNKIYLANWKARDPVAWETYQRNREVDSKFQKKRKLQNNNLFDRLFAEQNGLCAICSRPPSCQKGRFAVDHCHKTGTVRGLLCLNCNSALGNAHDNVALLRKMIEYLERYS